MGFLFQPNTAHFHLQMLFTRISTIMWGNKGFWDAYSAVVNSHFSWYLTISLHSKILPTSKLASVPVLLANIFFFFPRKSLRAVESIRKMAGPWNLSSYTGSVAYNLLTDHILVSPGLQLSFPGNSTSGRKNYISDSISQCLQIVSGCTYWDQRSVYWPMETRARLLLILYQKKT